MRKVCALLMATFVMAVLAVGVVGCSGGSSPFTQGPSPSNSVKGALDAIKAQDEEALAQYYSGDVAGLANPTSALDGSAASSYLGENAEMTDEQRAVLDEFVQKVLEFDYTVGEEKIDGDKATVEVTMNTYDFGGMFSSVLSTAVSQYMSSALSGDVDTVSSTQIVFDSLKDEVGALTSKTKTTTAAVNVTKDADGNWKVDDISENKAFADAMLGGLVSSVQDMMGGVANLLGNVTGEASDKAA